MMVIKVRASNSSILTPALTHTTYSPLVKPKNSVADASGGEPVGHQVCDSKSQRQKKGSRLLLPSKAYVDIQPPAAKLEPGGAG